MPIWSEFVESSLDTIRQNTTRLSKIYKEKYESLRRNIWITTTVPVSALSIYSVLYNFNAGDLEDMPYANTANQVTSVFLAMYTMSQLTGFNMSSTLEKYSMMSRNYETTSKEIDTEMKNETKHLEGSEYLDKTLQKYKNLVMNDDMVKTMKGSFDNTTENLCKTNDEIKEYLDDQWNIIFRPTLRRIKKKNHQLIKALEDNARDVQTEIENEGKSVWSSVSELFVRNQSKNDDVPPQSEEEENKEVNVEQTEEDNEQNKTNQLRSLFGLFSPDVKEESTKREKSDIEMSQVYEEKEESALKLPNIPISLPKVASPKMLFQERKK